MRNTEKEQEVTERYDKIGATYGLSRPRPDRRGGPVQSRFDPEQVYVRRDTEAEEWTDGDGHTHPPRRICIDGWIGYSSAGGMALTDQQARDLRTLLTAALGDDPEAPATDPRIASELGHAVGHARETATRLLELCEQVGVQPASLRVGAELAWVDANTDPVVGS
jgi:hypothetical protein